MLEWFVVNELIDDKMYIGFKFRNITLGQLLGR
jgi:hypothetical protein